MIYKKAVSLILLLSLVINSFSFCVYAEEQSMDAYEYFTRIQKFTDAYAPDSLASVTPDNYLDVELNRLIVKTSSNTPLENDYGAIGKLEGYNGLHILQYETKRQTELAYSNLSDENIEYIEYDFYLSSYETTKFCYCQSNPEGKIGCECSTDESEHGVCTCTDNTSENHLSWNSSAVNVDEAFGYINSSGIIPKTVTVAVIDTGTYGEHSEFAPDSHGESRIVVDPKYVYMEDGIVYPSDNDAHYHGTHVAGIIHDNTMSNVKICPYRVHGETVSILTYTEFCGAIDAAVANGVGVINMSLNRAAYPDEVMYTFEKSINHALTKNIILIAAAGNDHKEVGNTIPASYEDLITVSATTPEMCADKSYSNYGECVDVGAPGTDIYSTVPRVERGGPNGNVIVEGTNLYMRMSGTSMAAPLVAAAAATLKSINPDMSAAEIQRIIKETAYVPESWDTKYGTGIVNFYNMVKQDVSGTPTIKLNSDNKIEITAPEGTDSRLYYTLDGSIPTIDNHLVYTEPFSISGKNINLITAVCHENGKLIGEAVKYRTKSFHTLKLDYKETIKPLNTEAKWYSWDTDVATVDRDGNITGAGVGETTVTAILESGRRINYNVYVEYTSWQWFIRIFLLGFLWY